MFTEEFLNRVFVRTDVRSVPLCYQSIMIHALEEEMEVSNATVSKSKLSNVAKPNAKSNDESASGSN